jgi:hypothetical protein
MSHYLSIALDLKGGTEGFEGIAVGRVFWGRFGLPVHRLKVLSFAVLPKGLNQFPVTIGASLVAHVNDVRMDVAKRTSIGQPGVVGQMAIDRRRGQRLRGVPPEENQSNDETHYSQQNQADGQAAADRNKTASLWVIHRGPFPLDLPGSLRSG